jgi:hypothetical protein
MVLIDSMPPATTKRASPAMSSRAPIITDLMPDGQAMLTVKAGTEIGMPPLTAAVRAGLTPLPA